MSFEVKPRGMDVERLLADVQPDRGAPPGRPLLRRRAALHRRARPRGGPPGRDLRADLVDEFRARDAQWNFAFDPETLYRSSRASWGARWRRRAASCARSRKLFWNPNPMIAALSRQSDLNRFSVHLLHNLVLELSRLNLECRSCATATCSWPAASSARPAGEDARGMVAYRDEGAKDGGA